VELLPPTGRRPTSAGSWSTCREEVTTRRLERDAPDAGTGALERIEDYARGASRPRSGGRGGLMEHGCARRAGEDVMVTGVQPCGASRTGAVRFPAAIAPSYGDARAGREVCGDEPRLAGASASRRRFLLFDRFAGVDPARPEMRSTGGGDGIDPTGGALRQGTTRRSDS